MSALQAHSRSLHPHTSTARKLLQMPGNFLRQILAGMDLRSRGALKRHAQKILEYLPEAMRPSTAAWVEERFAGASSLKDGHLYLDIALLVFHRARMQEQGDICCYAWGDSLKTGHLDMYNTRQRWLPLCRVGELARAFKWLCANQAIVDPSNDVSEEDMDARAVLRSEFSQLLFDNIHLRT